LLIGLGPAGCVILSGTLHPDRCLFINSRCHWRSSVLGAVLNAQCGRGIQFHFSGDSRGLVPCPVGRVFLRRVRSFHDVPLSRWLVGAFFASLIPRIGESPGHFLSPALSVAAASALSRWRPLLPEPGRGIVAASDFCSFLEIGVSSSALSGPPPRGCCLACGLRWCRAAGLPYCAPPRGVGLPGRGLGFAAAFVSPKGRQVSCCSRLPIAHLLVGRRGALARPSFRSSLFPRRCARPSSVGWTRGRRCWWWIVAPLGGPPGIRGPLGGKTFFFFFFFAPPGGAPWGFGPPSVGQPFFPCLTGPLLTPGACKALAVRLHRC